MSTQAQLGFQGFPQARALVRGICQFDHGGKVHIESHQEPGVFLLRWGVFYHECSEASDVSLRRFGQGPKGYDP